MVPFLGLFCLASEVSPEVRACHMSQATISPSYIRVNCFEPNSSQLCKDYPNSSRLHCYFSDCTPYIIQTSLNQREPSILSSAYTPHGALRFEAGATKESIETSSSILKKALSYHLCCMWDRTCRFIIYFPPGRSGRF